MRLITALAVIGTGAAAAILLKRRARARGITAREQGFIASEESGEPISVKGAGRPKPVLTPDTGAGQRFVHGLSVISAAAGESAPSYPESSFAGTAVPADSESETGCPGDRSVPTANSEPRGAKARGRTKMRITKRSSGGRGEYEVSESFGSLAPRDLVDHTILLDLGSQVEIRTGVRLLLKHGKLRLRIDEKAGCEIHLHRQLAAALILPYPVREESGWALYPPVLQSGLYGIRNIEFSSVTLLANRIARMTVGSVSAANQAGEEYVQVPERLAEVMRVWELHAEFPPELASLLAEHKRLVQAGGPITLRAEEVVSGLQEAAARYQAGGAADFSASRDVLPYLTRLPQPARLKVGIGGTASEPRSTQNMIADIDLTAARGADEDGAATDVGLSAVESAGYEMRVSTSVELRADIQSKQDESQPEISELSVTDSLPAAPGEPEIVGQADEPEEAESRVSSPPSPRKYRPQPRGAVAATRGSLRGAPPRGQRDVSIPVDLRLRSRVGGTYLLTLLPRRRAGMPSELEAVHSGRRIQLSAFHEEWYQDVVLPEAGRLLREGLAWYTEGSDGDFRWSLAGREVFVLGTRSDLSGYVSVPRLMLGAQHIVVCYEEVLQQVLGVLRECCEHIPQTFEESDGLPAGWVGIGPVVPTVPLASSETGDIYDALRPDPAVSIEFEGGLRIRHNQFLVNYPPHVRVYGSIPDFVQVIIDGRTAEKTDGGFVSTEWDALGGHTVSCGAVSRSYTIVEPDDGWESWTAYLFDLSMRRGAGASASVCGALVTAGPTGTPALLVPASTPVLLGSRPGEIYTATIREDMRMGFCPAFPPFAPIWAVPQNPLRSDKASARVMLLKESAPASQAGADRQSHPSRAVRQWCTAILDCCRKGLDVDPPEDNARRLWRSYRDAARHLWRASR